jgi:hypothetical protein
VVVLGGEAGFEAAGEAEEVEGGAWGEAASGLEVIGG